METIKIATAKEYKGEAHFIMHLPSGFNWKMRNIPGELMPDLMTIYNEQRGVEYESMTNEQRMTYIKRVVDGLRVIVPACAIEPKVVAGKEESDDAISFRDINFQDLFAILGELFQRIGATPEEAARRENFPEVSLGKPSEI